MAFIRPPAAATLAVAALLAALGCTEESPTAPGPALSVAAAPGAPAFADPGIASGLAQLRALTAPFHRFEAGEEAGWDAPVTDCRENPPVGGMGYHYANLAYLLDGGAVDVLEPEVLIYEPQKNGRLRLVGVEYVVLFDDVAADAAPPELLGQTFLPNTNDGLWMLHVWVWKNNPHGMFATWNPTVSCRYAS